MEYFEATWNWIVSFIGGRNSFMIVVATLSAWFVVTRTLRGIKNTIFLTLGVFFSPLRFRRVFFNFISLVFMVGGTATAGAAKGKLGGSDGTLEAFVAGGGALAVWGFFMLCVTHYKESRPEKPIEKIAVKS